MSDVQAAGDALKNTRRIVILTGAGTSAESGIPTFRDALTGLWAKYDPAQLATPEAFAEHPAQVTQWYDERRLKVAACKPNAGHTAIAQLQRWAAGQGRSCVLTTQNVDRLHQAAGSQDVIELHGNLWTWRCINCDRARDELGPAFASYPLRCECGGLRRPGVVWFGEELDSQVLNAAGNAIAGCDFFLSIGTSSVVYPAAGLIEQAIRREAKTLEINPAATPFSQFFDWSIRATSAAALPELVSLIASK